MTISHIRELFDYTHWANLRLYDASASIDDAGLDREFEIGFGTLRKTMNHLYAAERIWYERHEGTGYDEPLPWKEILSVAAMRAAHESLHQACGAWLGSLRDDELARPVTYTDPRGEEHTNSLGDILIHVCDHGAHHRAQAANMTRHIGTPFVRSDYLNFKLTHPTMRPASEETLASFRETGLEIEADLSPARPLSVDCLRAQFEYNDWANRSVVVMGESLSNEQLDRPFEMGMGTLRKTLLHIEAAERYWLQNWLGSEAPSWESMDEGSTATDVQGAFDRHREARTALLRELDDDALDREVSAAPVPGKSLHFRLGETMLQICFHGTHHRAQAINMLRRTANAQTRIDYITWRRLAKEQP